MSNGFFGIFYVQDLSMDLLTKKLPFSRKKIFYLQKMNKCGQKFPKKLGPTNVHTCAN